MFLIFLFVFRFSSKFIIVLGGRFGGRSVLVVVYREFLEMSFVIWVDGGGDFF